MKCTIFRNYQGFLGLNAQVRPGIWIGEEHSPIPIFADQDGTQLHEKLNSQPGVREQGKSDYQNLF
ncbi:MAG: hypothetical protein D6748_10770 [Calditrichaeota bacterium]|nr:MAG: hypothetical protein D6748_10770 [Calditrichota bacterium]